MVHEGGEGGRELVVWSGSREEIPTSAWDDKWGRGAGPILAVEGGSDSHTQVGEGGGDEAWLSSCPRLGKTRSVIRCMAHQ